MPCNAMLALRSIYVINMPCLMVPTWANWLPGLLGCTAVEQMDVAPYIEQLALSSDLGEKVTIGRQCLLREKNAAY